LAGLRPSPLGLARPRPAASAGLIKPSLRGVADPAPATLGLADLQELLMRRLPVYKCHGDRSGRLSIAVGSESPRISSLSGSQRILRFSRMAMLPRLQIDAVRWPSSTEPIGSCRVLMQSRKLRTWSGR